MTKRDKWDVCVRKREREMLENVKEYYAIINKITITILSMYAIHSSVITWYADERTMIQLKRERERERKIKEYFREAAKKSFLVVTKKKGFFFILFPI